MIELIKQFQKEASELKRDADSMVELRLWLQAQGSFGEHMEQYENDLKKVREKVMQSL